VYRIAEKRHEDLTPSQIREAIPDADCLVWIDMTSPDEDDEALLRDALGLHPLAVEAIREDHTRASCASYPGCYVMVMYDPDWPEDDRLSLKPVVIFVGPRFLVTVRTGPTPEVDRAIRLWRTGGGMRPDTIATPLYQLLDALADDYFPITDRTADQIDDLETQLFAGDGDSQVSGVFGLKRDLLVLRRAVAGQRDALNVLLRQDIPILEEGGLVFFQSIYDHLTRLVETIDTYRDLLSTAMDIHLSVVSNRLNQVMKTLTVISTILMTGGLIAGIYGMNFANMPELRSPYGYYCVLLCIVGLSAGLVVYFRRIRWL
jgi:magnesium transporter